MLFQTISENITHNQLILESRILQIQQAIQSSNQKQIEVNHYFLLQMLISQILTAFQEIYNILEKIQIAITFSKLNTFYNSIINPYDLLLEIQSIAINLSFGKLPFLPNIDNILVFEKILQIKSYSKENEIIFIIKVPIVEKRNFILYLPLHSNTIKLYFHKRNTLSLMSKNTQVLTTNAKK